MSFLLRLCCGGCLEFYDENEATSSSASSSPRAIRCPSLPDDTVERGGGGEEEAERASTREKIRSSVKIDTSSSSRRGSSTPLIGADDDDDDSILSSSLPRAARKKKTHKSPVFKRAKKIRKTMKHRVEEEEEEEESGEEEVIATKAFDEDADEDDDDDDDDDDYDDVVVCADITDDLDRLDLDPKAVKIDSRFLDLPKSFALPREISFYSESKDPSAVSKKLRIACGVASVMGGREYQEDEVVARTCLGSVRLLNRAFFGVFDGHGGSKTSRMLRERLPDALIDALKETHTGGGGGGAKKGDVEEEVRIALEQSFQNVDRAHLADVRRGEVEDHSGSTACVVLVSGTKLFCANAGDTRAVLCRKNGDIRPLSFDHKAVTPKERRRIERAGGEIRSGRVMGVIATARGFGDIEYKRTVQGGKMYWGTAFRDDLISASPDVEVCDVDIDDEFFIIASDGVWDAIPNVKCATNFVRRALREGRSVEKAALSLVKYAAGVMGKRSDNCSAVIVLLNVSFEDDDEEETRDAVKA